MMWKCRFLAFFALISAASLALAADEQPPTIAAEDAAAHLNQEVVIEYTVKSGRVLDDKRICFLNSETSNRSDKNFTAFITPGGMRAYKDERKIENPAAEFLGKKIRVKGKVLLHKSKPEIKVERPGQIEIVKDPTPEDAGNKSESVREESNDGAQ